MHTYNMHTYSSLVHIHAYIQQFCNIHAHIQQFGLGRDDPFSQHYSGFCACMFVCMYASMCLTDLGCVSEMYVRVHACMCGMYINRYVHACTACMCGMYINRYVHACTVRARICKVWNTDT